MVAIARAFPGTVLANQDYAAGIYYPNSVPGITTIGAHTNLVTANIYFMPFFCTFTHTFTAIAFTNSASVNTKKFRLGIYNSSGRFPSTKVLDSGELTVSDANTATIRSNSISQSLNANTLYWLAFQCDTDNPSVFGPTVVNGYDWLSEFGSFGNAPTNDAYRAIGYGAVNTYGALPTNAPTPTITTDVNNLRTVMLYLKG